MHLLRRGNSKGPPDSASGGPPSEGSPEEASTLADPSGGATFPASAATGPPPASAQNGGAPVSAAQANPYFGEDVDDKIEGTGCSKEYSALQDCLDDTDKSAVYRHLTACPAAFRRACTCAAITSL
ncbi:hypothetical protein Emag_002504 [Eimeria magna]